MISGLYMDTCACVCTYTYREKVERERRLMVKSRERHAMHMVMLGRTNNLLFLEPKVTQGKRLRIITSFCTSAKAKNKDRNEGRDAGL